MICLYVRAVCSCVYVKVVWRGRENTEYIWVSVMSVVEKGIRLWFYSPTAGKGELLIITIDRVDFIV